MRARCLPILSLVPVGLLVVACAAAVPPEANGPLVLTLRSSAQAASSVVRLEDVADIEGGTTTQRRQAAALDLAELDAAHPELLLTREHVFFRLRLAGFEPAQFRLTGTPIAKVTRGQTRITEHSLVNAARELVRGQLPPGAEDVDIRQVRTVLPPAVTLRPADQVRLAVELRSPAAAGRVKVDVAVFVNGQRRSVVPVLLDVSYAQQVAVVKRRVGPGELLKDEALTAERQMVDGTNAWLSFAEARGKRAKTTLSPGQRLTDADVETAPQDLPLLVKARDRVRLIAHVGGFRVSAMGEALQDGREGQTIRVRNVDSNKIISGRVLERNVVEVEY